MPTSSEIKKLIILPKISQQEAKKAMEKLKMNETKLEALMKSLMVQISLTSESETKRKRWNDNLKMPKRESGS